jgi:transaldolase
MVQKSNLITPAYDENMAVWKKLLIQIVPVVITVVVSITGAYIALNSQVSVLAVEVGRLTKVVDTLSAEGVQNRGLADEVKRLTTAVEGLKAETMKSAVRDIQIEQDRSKLSKMEGDVQAIMSGLSDLRVTAKVLEREVENLRRELKKGGR